MATWQEESAIVAPIDRASVGIHLTRGLTIQALRWKAALSNQIDQVKSFSVLGLFLALWIGVWAALLICFSGRVVAGDLPGREATTEANISPTKTVLKVDFNRAECTIHSRERAQR